MLLKNLLLRRTLSTQKNDIGQIFIQENVQKLLRDITRFEEGKLFARRTVQRFSTPKLMFMTDEHLQKAKQEAYEHAKARMQMPPVMAANNREPAILARDEDIVGYTKFRIMFVDISTGFSNRNRLMSVREPDGILREPTDEERSRLNNILYPAKSKSIDPPKLFEEKNLARLLGQKQYKFVLDKACVQFEPDDPRYVEITNKVYNYINEKNDFNLLRSTRHFGPMSLSLAYSKQADNLILEMLSKNLIEDAAKLVKIYNTCHDLASPADDPIDDLRILRHYVENHSSRKYNLDLALQSFEKDRSNEGTAPAQDEPNK